MKIRPEIILLIVATLVLVLAGWGVWAILNWAQGNATVFAALVAASGSMVVAVMTHRFTVLREQGQEIRKQKQANYQALLEKIPPYIRDAGPSDKGELANRDLLETVHLHSWVVGAPDVVRAVEDFVEAMEEDRKLQKKAAEEHRVVAAGPAPRRNLTVLLVAMRKDIGLEEVLDGHYKGLRVPNPTQGGGI